MMAIATKHYGVCHLLWDTFLVFATGGLWLIWLVVRALRSV